ncbi:MAG: glutamine amidotransferase [Syntrophaceticus sp.]|nr:glutamine amidotransferase [Syntrophaceticus sp.]MDD3314399.1 glutamine amidotransferase [Syntrophaceticus sp.]MDD4359914.1 glutamine amidotransferase [Syntrophaceticus sp.]MDD4782738.1 glutamine amidotransferase [Syntrophaceticus sp.]
MRIKVCHLYPDLFNLYGDQGNLLIFCRRAQWRGIQVEVDMVSFGETICLTGYDFVFLGGGAESNLSLMSKELQEKGRFIVEAVEQGTVLLAIGLGFQVLGRFIKTQDGAVLPGAGVFDLYIETGMDRLVGDILLETAVDLQEEMKKTSVVRETPLATLVGFENHAGRTFLGKEARPLGRVLKGQGNNRDDLSEGARYKNAFGSYLHGPLLAKNPHLADLLLSRAILRQGGGKLTPLNDELEIYAHNVIKNRLVGGYNN